MFSLILSGCVSVDTNQKIYRDETTDINVRITAESAFILNQVKDGMLDDLSSDWIYSEDGESFSISQKNVKIKSFKYSSAEDSLFGTGELKKDFKFPYYYYTYSFINKVKTDNQDAEVNEYAEKMKDLISISYNIEGFGEIEDSNGLKTSDKSVRFKLEFEPKTDTKYYVTFKDLFINNWFNI